MNRIILAASALFMASLLPSCGNHPDGISGATKDYDSNGNSFYHRTTETKLKTCDLRVEGEVRKPGEINLKNYFKREVVYKQAVLNDSGQVAFTGAYRYRGYSLFDLLNPFILQKKNAKEFIPATDVYIIIENDSGDRVVFSWAEIFLGHNMHQVIIATEQADIEPHKVKVSYPKDSVWKVVAANDLFAYRELKNPSRIIVKSFDRKHYEINRELENPFSPTVNVVVDDSLMGIIDTMNATAPHVRYHSVFYGMGMGYHDTPIFEGPLLRPLIERFIFKDEAKWMQAGVACVVGKDGFRNIFSLGELFNRVDQVEPILAIPENPGKSGYYRLYHPSAFYADFSVRNLSEIYLFRE